jgi:tetratricopeptide (TPR) repeat protein
LGVATARLTVWGRRHPKQTVAGLILLAVLLGWAGYRGHRYWTARTLFRAAQQALDRRDWDAARQHLNACLRIKPDSPEAHRLAARACRRLELLNGAEQHLDTCQRLQGGETQAIAVERALLRVHRGDLTGTEDFLRACVAQDDPDTVEILDVLSTALILDYRLPEAHQCLDDLLQRQPNNFDILVRWAWIAQNQARYTEAVESRQRALELRPEAEDVRLALARDLLILGRYPEGREQLDALLQKRPNHSPVLFALAHCLAEQGEKDRAAKLLDQLIAQEPNNPALLGERGWLCLERDQPEKAETYLRLAQALSSPNQELLMRLSDCLRLLGKHDEARTYREQAERLHLDTVRALDLTKSYRERGRNDPDLCHELGTVLLRLDKPDDALRFFHKALKINPNHQPTHQSLAAFYDRAGAYKQAAYYRSRLEQNPSGARPGGR